VSRFHFEAGIAACHTLAGNDNSTDWNKILELYDGLLALDGSPVVALNRAVALARVRGPAAGLAAIAAIENRRALENNHLLHAVAGQLRLDSGDAAKAAASFRLARKLAVVEAEKEFISQRLANAEAAAKTTAHSEP
jgi:RNA polymerase sigma-70 factor (ECF subfamily)